MVSRIIAIIKKEFRQIRRDVRSLLLIFLFPLFLLVLFGYAISFDVKHIKIAVYDPDKSHETRQFIERLSSSENFDVSYYVGSPQEINDILDEKKVQCVIVFPYNFSKKLSGGEKAELQFLIDGVDGNTASVIMNYMNAAAKFFSAHLIGRKGNIAGVNTVPVELQPRFWYNPELNTTKFLIPGLAAMILIITGVILTTLSIVREKELGTMEQLKVSHLKPFELIAGKTVPYTFIAMMVAAFILSASYVLFGIEIKGSIFMLFAATLVYLIGALSLGIFISTVANSQQTAFQIAAVATMLPTFILSGFIFPIVSMPPAIQILTNLTPAKFYIVILRSIVLKGAGLESYWRNLIYLGIFAAIFLGVASIRIKKFQS